jgi:hypothetical protein
VPFLWCFEAKEGKSTPPKVVLETLTSVSYYLGIIVLLVPGVCHNYESFSII